MGSKRITPKRLAEKLKKIREDLKVTNEELIDRLNCPEIPLYRASITQYEKGQREPPLSVLLRYARLYGISVESLIDDGLDLSDKCPSNKYRADIENV